MRSILALLLVAALAVLAVDLIAKSRPAEAKAVSAAPIPGPLVYKQGTFELRLTDRPCSDDDAIEVLESEGVPPAKVYETYSLGQRRAGGCWALDIGGDVMTVDAAGVGGTVPIKWFKRDPGA